ncbi:hypothetical protein J6590_052437 [Homalodisca vitripennis]|nr:hypothetical protein J6590_052437 [Homalodisca vitripennis]
MAYGGAHVRNLSENSWNINPANLERSVKLQLPQLVIVLRGKSRENDRTQTGTLSQAVKFNLWPETISERRAFTAFTLALTRRPAQGGQEGFLANLPHDRHNHPHLISAALSRPC